MASLRDGLESYKGIDGVFTQRLEREAVDIIDLLRIHGDAPTIAALSQTKLFLIGVEKWKAMCLEDRIGNAERNSDLAIWQAFQTAAAAQSDLERIRSIMRLIGFGAVPDPETGQRRAKVATSVLRFLWPMEWGVVDWRIVAMLSLLEKCKWDVDGALNEASKFKAYDLRKVFDVIDEKGACAINAEYRKISSLNVSDLPRAADVDMALFGLSLMAWPLP